MKLLAVLIAGVAGGFLAGTFVADDAPATVTDDPPEAPVTAYFDSSAPADERLARLEATVAQERDARLVLEEQIALLLEEIDRLDTEGPSVIATEIGQMVAVRERRDRRQNSAVEAARAEQGDWRAIQVRQLTGAGFSPDRAQAIVNRSSELQWEVMRDRYEARSAGNPRAYGLEGDPNWRLRQELGEQEYERYLRGLGMPTEVQVTSVMGSSPANAAGFAPGDVILAYNGTRVYSMRELQVLSTSTTPGQNAVVEVQRDGARLQFTLPAGPMGLQARAMRTGN